MTVMGVFCWAFLACCSFKESTLHLKFTEGTCSGTAVAKDVILTAEHCLGQGGSLSFVNDKPVVALETVKDGKDHVLIRVSGIEFKKWVKMGPPLEQADEVRWIGNPAGEPDMYREGYVVKVTPNEIVIDAPSFSGDSGAGVFDERGRLVAMISGITFWNALEGFSMQFALAFPLSFTPEQLEKMSVK